MDSTDTAALQASALPAPKSSNRLKEILFFACILLALHTVVGARSNVLLGNFIDTDVYTWLNRVTHLHDTGAWYDRALPRVNPPKGHLQHWSRPFDVTLYAGAAVGAPFVGFSQALEHWAVWVSPFLQIITLIILLLSVRTLFKNSDEALPIVGFLFLGHSSLLLGFAAGRADHQSLLLLLCVGVMTALAQMLKQSSSRNWAIGAGALCALGIWVSVEFMLVAGIIHLTLGMAWLREGREWARTLTYFSTGMAAAGLLVLLGHSGLAGTTSRATDEVSGLYLLMLIQAALFWSAAFYLGKQNLQSWTARTTFAAACLGGVIAILFVVMADVLTGPLGEVVPLYEQVRLRYLGELQPVVSLGRLAEYDAMGLAKRVLPKLGLSLVAAWSLATIARRYWRDPADASNRVWLGYAVGFAMFVPLACYQVRWMGYAAVMSVPLAALTLTAAIRGLRITLPQASAGAVSLVIILSAAVGFNAPTFMPSKADRQSSVLLNAEGSALRDLASHLSDPNGLGSQKLNILAYVDFGPELMYRTPHAVFAMPNHRPQPGFVTSYHAMSAEDPQRARSLIQDLGVDLILVSTHSIEASFYDPSGDKDTFQKQLLDGRIPAWLEEDELPEGISEGYRIFRPKPSTKTPDVALRV
jgi:hypothetical protein